MFARSPQNYFLIDPVTDLTYAQFYHERLQQFRLPHWNPYILSGHPLIASPSLGWLYPPKLVLNYLFRPDVARTYNILLHAFLAGILMYGFLRSLRLGFWGALTGGIAWMLNGYGLVWLEYPLISISALLPLTLWLCHRGYVKKQPVFFMGAGVSLGMSMGAAVMQYGAYNFLMTGWFILVCIGRDLWARRQRHPGIWDWKPFGFWTGCLVILFGVALLASAAQVLPTLELFGQGTRAGGVSWTAYFPTKLTVFRALLLPGFFIPDFSSSPIDLDQTRELHMRIAATNYLEFQGYAGMIPFLLALVGFFKFSDRIRLFWGGVALFSILSAIITPVYWLIYPFPGMASAASVRLLYLYAFATAVLAGFGAHHLAVHLPDRAQMAKLWLRGVWVYLLVAAFFLMSTVILTLGQERLETSYLQFIYQPVANAYSIYNPGVLLYLGAGAAILGMSRLLIQKTRYPALLMIFLTVGITLDLLIFSWRFNPAMDKALSYPSTPGIEFLKRDQSLYRIILIRPGPDQGRVFPNTFMPYNIQEVGGYESLGLYRYSHLMAQFDRRFLDVPKQWSHVVFMDRYRGPLLDFLNVKYIVTSPLNTLEHDRLEPVYHGPDLAIYRNRAVLPRATAVHRYRVITDEDRLVDRLAGEAFDPTSTVYFEYDPGSPMPPEPVDRVSSARVVSYEPTSVAVEADMAHEGFVVLSDAWYPGWRVRVDGQPRELLRANYTFRAVYVPAGAHRIEFVYRPTTVYRGIGLSLGAFGLLGAALLIPRCRRWTFRGSSETDTQPGNAR